MKKRSMLIIGIMVVLGVAGVFAYRAWAGRNASSGSDVQTALVERGSLSSTLGSSGNTRSGQNATVTWQTSGKVTGVTLAQGDRVEEDQLLAELDPSSLSTELIQARQDLIDAQQALEDLLNSTSQQAKALQAVEDAQQALDSLKEAASEGSSQAQLALAQAKEALEDAQKARDRMNYPHSSDELVIEKAETEYLLAKEAYKEARQAYELVDQKKLTNPERVLALNRLVAAEADMEKKLATYNWYLLDYTENDIAEADAELAVAQAALETAQANWERLKDGTTDAQIMLAEATLADAQREWERVKDGPDQADIDAAQAAVDAAQATLDRAQLQAPFAGIITDVDVSNGDLVSAGDAAFRIDDMDSLYIDLQISEVDLASLEVGQAATIEFDAIADNVYSGEVVEIGMVGSVSNGVVNYPVTVRITDADEDILPGMTASVSIILAEKNDALLVPNRAIRTTNGQKTVTILFEGQQFNIPVESGLVGDSMTEVISTQLQEGDTVVVNGTTTTASSSNTFERGGGMMIIEGGPPPGMP